MVTCRSLSSGRQVSYVNTHAQLEARRDVAMANEGLGPRYGAEGLHLVRKQKVVGSIGLCVRYFLVGVAQGDDCGSHGQWQVEPGDHPVCLCSAVGRNNLAGVTSSVF